MINSSENGPTPSMVMVFARYFCLDVVHEEREVVIVGNPKFDHLFPIGRCPSLKIHPIVLAVSREFEMSLLHRSNELLLVVAGRINQVPEDFFLRPLIGCGPTSNRRIVNLPKHRGDGFYDLTQLLGDGFHFLAQSVGSKLSPHVNKSDVFRS